jgi:ribonucleoside-diphosphate reductase alpha chain
MNDFSHFAWGITEKKYAHTRPDGSKETWKQIAQRVSWTVLSAVNAPTELISRVTQYIEQRKFIPGGRYLYATGRPFHQTQNCLLLRAEDSREGWADLLHKASMALMTGAGIGVTYGRVRGEGKAIRKTGGVSTGPIALMKMINEVGREVMQGGSRRSAIWAGLPWNHPDVHKFITLKDWSADVVALKAKDFNFPAPMDMTNISVQLNDEFFEAYHCQCPEFKPNLEGVDSCVECGANVRAHHQASLAQGVYWAVIRHMLETGEPGFSIDCGENTGEELRNACTEITSHEDSDICNLGSINMARIESLKEMLEVTEAATAFLLAGTVYSDVPYARVDQIRTKNRRLGLGLMGIHEWLLINGHSYGPCDDLTQYLYVYAETSRRAANYWADEWDLSRPVKVRAIAPTGTIGIVGETTTGCEPIFCNAYKRRYLIDKVWHYEYVIDPTAKRLIGSGIAEEAIEQAYHLAKEPERRVAFQAHLQDYVDHAISSTINLPRWGSEHNNESKVRGFGEMLVKYLPRLRGITCYPDGARGGQPLTPVPLHMAMLNKDVEFKEEYTDICSITGKGGTCGE